MNQQNTDHNFDKCNIKPVTQWGVWSFWPGDLTLTHSEVAYCIYLAEINSTAMMLDFIYQFLHKAPEVYGDKCVEDLMWAFDDIFEPQANCCSYGVEKKFKGKDFAEAYSKKVLAYRKQHGCL